MHSRGPRVHIRLLALVIAMTVLAFAFVSFTLAQNVKPVTATSPTPSNSVTIWLNGDAVGLHPGWNDSDPGPTITVVSGVTVHLLLNATDPLTHQFFVNTLQNGQPDPNGITSPTFSTGSTGVLNYTFTPVIGQNIPSAGNWTYLCYFHPTLMIGTFRVVPPDFTISADPTNIFTTVGTTGKSTIVVSFLPSFTGTVTLSTSTSNVLQASVNPQTISGTSGTATLTVKASAANNYTATVTATTRSLTYTFNVTVEVEDFGITADPSILPAQIDMPAMTTLTISSINHFDGTVNLTSNSTLCSISQTILKGPGTTMISCTFRSPGQYPVNLTGTNGTLVHSIEVIFDVAIPDYQTVANPSSVTMLADQTGNSTITIQSINGFTGTIHLLVSSSSPVLDCQLNSTTVIVPTNVAAELSCKGNAGTYKVVVVATNGTIVRGVSIPFTVQDFTITTPTITVAADAYSTISVPIVITELDGFKGTSSITIAGASGLTVSAVPIIIPDGSGVVMLTIMTTAAGNYTIDVAATSGPLAHAVEIEFQVQDFTVTTNPTTFTVMPDRTTSINLHISSVNNFKGNISLATASAYCQLSPLKINNSGNATLTCTFPTPGTFLVNVTAYSRSLSRSQTITFVSSNIQQSAGLSLPDWLLVALASAAILAGVISYLFLRRRWHSSTRPAASNTGLENSRS